MVARNFFSKLLLILCVVCSLVGCAGGGGGGDSRGFGTEGTGFKIELNGVILDDADGSPIAQAMVSTADATTVTDEQGKFGLQTALPIDGAVEVEVEKGAVKGSVALNPIAPGAGKTVSVKLKANKKSGKVKLDSQVESTATDNSNSSGSTDFSQQVTDTNNDILGSGGNSGSATDTPSDPSMDPSLDPNTVDL